MTVSPEQPSDVSAELRVSIEERLAAASGAIAREYTFVGNANELLVLYIEDNAESDSLENNYSPMIESIVELYSPAGQKLQERYDYPEDFDFQETEGSHLVFSLPETGTYRLVFEADTASKGGEAAPVDFLLKARVADYYERLLIFAHERFNQDRYEEALSFLDLATEQSPGRPASYLARVATYAEMLFEAPDFYEQLDLIDTNSGDEEAVDAFIALVYERFSTLERNEQSTIVNDLRLLEGLYKRAIVNGEFEPETGFEPSLFADTANFLATGVPNDAIKQILFGL